MKITRIEFIESCQVDLEIICDALVRELAKNGFITEARVVSSTAIKLGLRVRSFKIDTDMLGHNYAFGPFIKTNSGFRRTNVPTWSQRVQYNNIVNAVLNQYKLSANVKSAELTIRRGTKVFSASHWLNQISEYNRTSGYNHLIRTLNELKGVI